MSHRARAASVATRVGYHPGFRRARGWAVRAPGRDGLESGGFHLHTDGRIVYVERDTGETSSTPRRRAPIAVLPDRRGQRDGDEGLGVALHPGCRGSRHVVSLSRPGSAPRATSGSGSGACVVTPDIRCSAVHGPRQNHNEGDRLVPDGKLYVVIGDGGRIPRGQDPPASRVQYPAAQPHRSVPDSNPFPGSGVVPRPRNRSGSLRPRTATLESGTDPRATRDQPHRRGATSDCDPRSCPDTNQDGPDPIPPIWNFDEPVAVTGTAFCDRCGLGAALNGDLFVGCTNGTCKDSLAPIGHASLNQARDDFAGALRAVALRNFSGPVYSMEVGPHRRLTSATPMASTAGTA